MSQDIVITRAGVRSALGQDLLGPSALAPVSGLETFGCFAGAKVAALSPAEITANRKNLKLMTPSVRLGLAALKQAAIEGAVAPERLGVLCGAGTSLGDMAELGPALAAARLDDGGLDAVAFGRVGMAQVSPLWLLKGLANNILGFGTAELDARGLNQNYSASAAGGLVAVGEAFFALREGRADLLLAGGADSLWETGQLAGLARMGAWSDQLTLAPFTVDQRGTLPSEGAAFFALERASQAAQAGRAPLATVLAFAQGFVADEPEALAAVLRQALAQAGLKRLDAVIAHGEGHPARDALEAKALSAVLGDVPVVADKARAGFAGAASGVLGLALALCCGRTLPAQGPARDLAPGCEGLDLVTDAPRVGRFRTLGVHALGLGGQSAFLIVEVP